MRALKAALEVQSRNSDQISGIAASSSKSDDLVRIVDNCKDALHRESNKVKETRCELTRLEHASLRRLEKVEADLSKLTEFQVAHEKHQRTKHQHQQAESNAAARAAIEGTREAVKKYIHGVEFTKVFIHDCADLNG